MALVKLAAALLRRKELSQKVEILKQIKNAQIYENIVQRIKIDQGIDEVTAKVPKLTASQVTAEFDWHARQLRKIDAAIQHINWTTDVHLDDDVMADYKAEK